jgi:glyoxylase-like metal-dependent hydrolase (beta-lactamase superfamily II)
MPNDKVSVRVRMYRQGLGDCFLLTFRHGSEPERHLLIDCGLFQNTANENQIMNKVAESIEQTVGGRLDAVAVTHEHWDHISGFSQAKTVFDRITFGEVWLGWPDDEKHPQHKALRERFAAQLQGLKAAVKKMESGELQSLKNTVNALVNEFFAPDALGATGNGRSAAWKYVLDKGGETVKFCRPGQVLTIGGLAGVRVYVLGPPENFNLFSRVEPGQGESYRQSPGFALANSFFAAAAGSDVFDAEPYLPFDENYRIDEEKARAADCSYSGFFSKHYGFNDNARNKWRRIDEDWLTAAGELALHLDNFTNNTCLALAIELVESEKILLFPGDAQFGNWISWQDVEWKIPTSDGGTRTIKITDILERTVFYKVGHHGSHNATLKKHGLEMMNNPELVAAISTSRAFAAKKKPPSDGWKMPEKPLLERLEEKACGRVILADEADNTELQKRCRNRLTATELAHFLAQVKFGTIADSPIEPLYIEYLVEG